MTARGDARSLEPDGEYCAAFSSTCAIAEAVRRGSSRTGRVGIDCTSSSVPLQGVVDLVARGRDDLRRVRPAGSVGTAPASIRAISRMFSNSRVSRSTSVRIRSLCSRRSSARQPRRLDVAGGDANRRQRRAQVVPQRRQQGGLQVLAWRVSSAALRSSRNAPARWRSPPPPPARRACRLRSAGRSRPAGRWAWCQRAAEPAEPCGRPIVIVRWPA